MAFEELQTLWQKQPARGATPEQAKELTGAFRKFGRRNDAINCAKVAVVALNIVFLTNQLRHHPLAMFGAALALFAAVFFLIHDWRAQRSIARLNFADPSTSFLRDAISRLEALRNPFRNREFYIAMGGFWVGCTVMLVSKWPHLTVRERVLGHGYVTAAPFMVYWLGRLIRRKRFQSECQPLIERLTAVLQTIEEERS